MMVTTCPKCGFHQDGGEECLRCGIIFKRFHGRDKMAVTQDYFADPEPEASPRFGAIRSCYRVCRWVTLAVLVATTILILYPAPPPKVGISPEAALRAQVKVHEFQSSVRNGSHEILEMDESELNGWLGTNLATQRPAPKLPWEDHKKVDVIDISLSAKAPRSASDEDVAVEQVRTSVREVKMGLKEDCLLAYVAFDLYGMALSLELEGRVVVEDGYLRLEPIRGRLGSLPLLAGSLESATHRLFDAPQNREKFHLPPQIRDISIQDGRLLISSF
jgi:hypothetical protein